MDEGTPQGGPLSPMLSNLVLDAVAQAQRYIADGYNVVVDLDLEKFFEPSSITTA